MKVLVAIDGSDSCLRALDYVLAHTEVFGANPEITLLNVHLPIPSVRAKQWVGNDVIEAYYAEESEAQLAPAKAHVSAAGRTATAKRLVGDPAEQIAAVGRDHHMIVMGTHGRGALGNLVMGSVATRTVALSETPVLLVK